MRRRGDILGKRRWARSRALPGTMVSVPLDLPVLEYDLRPLVP